MLGSVVSRVTCIPCSTPVHSPNASISPPVTTVAQTSQLAVSAPRRSLFPRLEEGGEGDRWTLVFFTNTRREGAGLPTQRCLTAAWFSSRGPPPSPPRGQRVAGRRPPAARQGARRGGGRPVSRWRHRGGSCLSAPRYIALPRAHVPVSGSGCATLATTSLPRVWRSEWRDVRAAVSPLALVALPRDRA